MTNAVRRAIGVAVLVAGLSGAVPVVAVAQPGNCCCPPGQTGVIYGCTPFCVEGKFLDINTGLCTPIAAGPPQRIS
jgi:hypothetical protein